MTTPSPLEIRNGLLLTLKASAFTPAGSLDESVLLRAGISDAIDGLDALITPDGNPDAPAKLESGRGRPKWKPEPIPGRGDDG